MYQRVTKSSLSRPTTATASWLQGGGEMGERIRVFDWAQTPLGPLEEWPQSLRTSVNLILNSQHPMWIGWGPDITFLYNDAYVHVLGPAKHPSALGHPTAEVWEEIWDICGPLARKVFQNAEPTFVDDVRFFMDRGGFLEETFYSFSYSPIRDETGMVAGLFCPSTDATAKNLSVRRISTLSELASRAFVEKTVGDACKTAAHILGKNPDDVPFALLYLNDAKGKPVLAEAVGLAGESSAAEKDGIANFSWPIAAVMEKGQPKIVDLQHRKDFPIGPGNQRVTEAIILPILSRAQDGLGVLVAGVNPARQIDAEYHSFFTLLSNQVGTAIANAMAYQEERRRAEELAALDHAKTAFFSNVSHEFRTPLTLMLGPVEDMLARSSTEILPASREELELINRNGLRLLRLVNALLDFTRIEAGRVQASYEPTDLAAYTAELASVFRAATERAGLKLTVDCPKLPEPVFIDREMWEKIVLNLISNAFKFTFTGGITVSLKQVGSNVELRVHDTGVGIPAEEMPRLFERFHRIENTRSRTHEGSGIGLALVQELVKLHHGMVGAESVLGEGTTFIISIPSGRAHLPPDRIGADRNGVSKRAGAAPFVEEALRWLPGETDALVELELSQREVPHAAPPRGNEDKKPMVRPRVIVADDNADMRHYVTRLLAERYDVCAVADGEEAIAAARARRPELILSDVMMPKLDGFGLLKQVRADELMRTIPVILLSARAGEESRVEGLDAGADDYLVKPFSARELLARVESHLKLSRVRQEAEQRVTNILESITDGFQTVDAEWRFTSMNLAAQLNLSAQGIDPHSLIGKNFWEIFTSMLGTRAEKIYRRAMNQREPATLEYFYEPWCRWYSIRLFPIREGGLSIFFQDITEQRKAQQALSEAHEQLADKAKHLEKLVEQRTAKLRETIEELEAFSFSIAHDMRAPLRSLQGYGQFLAGEYENKIDDTGKMYIERIIGSAARMDRLILDVLHYSRLVRSEFPLEPVNLEKLLGGIVETYPNFQDGGSTIRLEAPLPLVLGNEAALTQCLSNLLGNAVKFVANGVKPVVRVWADKFGEQAKIFVQDNGIGIAPDQHEKIFAIFQRVNKGYEGTGIGLAIVKKAIERMGGRVGLVSELGQGSTFWIELKAVRPGDKT